MSNKSPITATIDFEKDGKQHGFLKLPYSSNESAWGSIMIPITCIKNGEGSTSLLTGGNHGDEYEGITSLLKLANSLEAKDIKGTVIIIPAMNYPAVLNGDRVSPIDNGNLNRAFPGKSDGTLTEKIADYFTTVLVPKSDYVLDIHSGGKTLDIIPFAAAHRLDDKMQEEKCIKAAQLFGAPYTLIMFELDAKTIYDTTVEKQGKVFVTTELRGGGTSSPKTIAYADCGIHNFLIYAGNIKGEYKKPYKTQMLDMSGGNCYVQSEHSGILEMTVELEDIVKKGDLVATIHNIERTGQQPVKYYAKMDGIIMAKRHPCLISTGDTFIVLAQLV